MFKSSLRTVIAAAACFCALAACEEAPPEPQATATPGGNKPLTPTAGAIAPDMVAAVSAGRGAAAIGIHFALRAPPTVNQALPVDIAIVPHRKFTMVRVRFEGRDGLATTAGEEFGPKTDVESETVLKHQIVLLPSKDGISMVTASVETEGDEGNVTRTFSIPVIVSGVSTPAAPAAPTAPAAAPPTK